MQEHHRQAKEYVEFDFERKLKELEKRRTMAQAPIPRGLMEHEKLARTQKASQLQARIEADIKELNTKLCTTLDALSAQLTVDLHEADEQIFSARQRIVKVAQQNALEERVDMLAMTYPDVNAKDLQRMVEADNLVSSEVKHSFQSEPIYHALSLGALQAEWRNSGNVLNSLTASTPMMPWFTAPPKRFNPFESSKPTASDTGTSLTIPECDPKALEALRGALLQDIERVTVLFKRLDANADGTCSLTEFRKALPMIQQKLLRETVKNSATHRSNAGIVTLTGCEMDALFALLDKDRSGTISYLELQTELRSETCNAHAKTLSPHASPRHELPKEQQIVGLVNKRLRGVVEPGSSKRVTIRRSLPTPVRLPAPGNGTKSVPVPRLGLPDQPRQSNGHLMRFPGPAALDDYEHMSDMDEDSQNCESDEDDRGVFPRTAAERRERYRLAQIWSIMDLEQRNAEYEHHLDTARESGIKPTRLRKMHREFQEQFSQAHEARQQREQRMHQKQEVEE